MLEEFKARNQVAYERYDSLTKQEQGIIDRWQALEYRLNPPAALVTGNQNGKRSGKNGPYGIFDTRQPAGYDKGKEGGGNELSPAGQGWGRPNRTNPGRPNAYAEYLAYKQKVQARQQSLALEQALQQLLVQEQAARTYAGPQAFAYNGADGFTGSGYETGGATGSDSAGGAGSSGGIDGAYEAGDSFGPSDLDGGDGADSVSSVGDTDGATGRILSEGESETKGKYEVSDSRREHILEGDPPGTGHGPNRGSSEGAFPDTWTDNQAIDAVERVANNPHSTWKQATGKRASTAPITTGGPDLNTPLTTNKGGPVRFKVQGQDHGLNIEVIVEPNGEGIITGYVLGGD